MPRYIDAIEAEAAIKDLFPDMPRIEFMGNRRRWREENEQYLRCLDAIRSVPTADAVERKHGKWIYLDGLDAFECSVCGRQMVRNIFDFCPWCGAVMDERRGKDV